MKPLRYVVDPGSGTLPLELLMSLSANSIARNFQTSGSLSHPYHKCLIVSDFQTTDSHLETLPTPPTPPS